MALRRQHGASAPPQKPLYERLVAIQRIRRHLTCIEKDYRSRRHLVLAREEDIRTHDEIAVDRKLRSLAAAVLVAVTRKVDDLRAALQHLPAKFPNLSELVGTFQMEQPLNTCRPSTKAQNM